MSYRGINTSVDSDIDLYETSKTRSSHMLLYCINIYDFLKSEILIKLI